MIIAINGVMGTGKSTLAKILGDKYRLPVIEESAEIEFPYSNLSRQELVKDSDHIESLQHYFMHQQIVNLRKAQELDRVYGGAILITHPWAQLFCYPKSFYALGRLSPAGFRRIQKTLEQSNCQLNQIPVFMINLLANYREVCKRITARSRNGESLDKDFILESSNSLLAYAMNQCVLHSTLPVQNLITDGFTPDELVSKISHRLEKDTRLDALNFLM